MYLIDLNLSVFNTIIGPYESKILTKHISCKCKSKFDCKKCNLNQNWSKDKCRCECKNQKEYTACENTCSCENAEYLTSTIEDSTIMCDDVINVEYSVSTNGSANVISTVSTIFIKKVVRKIDFYIVLTVLLVVILLFMIDIIYYNYAKHRSNLKNILRC